MCRPNSDLYSCKSQAIQIPSTKGEKTVQYAASGFPEKATHFNLKLRIDGNPNDAEKLGIKIQDNYNVTNGRMQFDGEYVNLTVNGVVLENVPVFIQPGQAIGTVGLAFGYGRTKAGKVAENFKAVTDLKLTASNAAGTITVTGGKNIVAKAGGAITIKEDADAKTAATIEKVTIDGLAAASTIGATNNVDALKELTVKNSTAGTLGVTTAVETLKVNFSESSKDKLYRWLAITERRRKLTDIQITKSLEMKKIYQDDHLYQLLDSLFYQHIYDNQSNDNTKT